jgi:hypothetical protein
MVVFGNASGCSREGAPIQPDLLNNFYVAFAFKNYGRSPAVVEDCVFSFHETATLATAPDYSLCQGKLICPASLPEGGEFETNQVGIKPGEDKQYTIFGKLIYKDVAGMTGVVA